MTRNSAKRQTGTRALAIGLGMCASGLTYAWLRPKLVDRPIGLWGSQVSQRLRSGQYSSARVAVAVARELLLENPSRPGADVRLLLAAAMCRTPAPDWSFIEPEVRGEVGEALSSAPRPMDGDIDVPRLLASLATLGGVSGLPSETTDLNGDGMADVVLAFPGGRNPSVCFAFLQTRRGWAPHTLAVGLDVSNLVTFRATNRGPTVLAVEGASGTCDVFAWQNGRPVSVLAERNATGPLTIELTGKATPESGKLDLVVPSTGARLSFRWDGLRYVGAGAVARPRARAHREVGRRPWTPPRGLDVELSRIEARIFGLRAFRDGLSELSSFETGVRASGLPRDLQDELLSESFYHRAICYRELGDTRRALATLTSLVRGNGPTGKWGAVAREWLDR